MAAILYIRQGWMVALESWGLPHALSAGEFAAEKCAMSFSTVLLGLGALLLSYKLARKYYSASVCLYASAALFLGTPLFYYMLIECGNANILAAFFMSLSLSIMLSMNPASPLQWFTFGVLYSFCLIIKVDLWFMSVLIALYYLDNLRLRRTGLSALFLFCAGLLPVFAMKLANDYLKYGVFHFGEMGLINIRGNYFFEQLFSPYRGYLYSSPILIICLAAGFVSLILSLRRKNSRSRVEACDHLCSLLFLYICIKFIICSFRYAWGGGNAGARQLLADYPIFVLLFGRALSGNNSKIRWPILIIACACIFWNLLTLAEYNAGIDLRNVPFVFDFSIKAFLPRLANIKTFCGP